MRTIALTLIKLYRYLISPWLGPRCRFYPSCSEYAEQAFKHHGFCKGAGLTLWRLLRCNPWNPGGVDHVPGCPCDTHPDSTSTSHPIRETALSK